MSCGIYKIQNIINHKIYIGQSVNIEARWIAHQNRVDNCYIHNAIQKYGINNFIFQIVQLCPKQLLNEKQIFYIKEYNSLMPNGYNMTPGGETGPGYITSKPVCQYTITGKFLHQYASVSEAGRQTNIPSTDISRCCLEKGVQQTGGYQWKYKNSDKVIKNNVKAKITTGVLQYSLDGILLSQYKTITQASLAVNRNRSSITNACRGFTKTCANYQWRYKIQGQKILKKIQPVNKKNNKKTYQYDLQNNLIATFISVKEASLKTGIDEKGISACCVGKKKSYKGYIWKH